jgi:hypothetical protein
MRRTDKNKPHFDDCALAAQSQTVTELTPEWCVMAAPVGAEKSSLLVRVL